MTLRLSLLGGFSVTHNKKIIELRSRNAQLLLAYVALSQNLVATRQGIAEFLWNRPPGAELSKQTRASLRQVLATLRKVLPLPNPLQISTREVWLERTTLEVDVWAITDSLRQGEKLSSTLLEQADFPGTLLADWDDTASEKNPRIDRWINEQRSNIRKQWIRHLKQILFDDMTPQPFPLSLQEDYATALLNLDPTHEGACCLLMWLWHRQGRSIETQKLYETLWQRLDESHPPKEPEEVTQDLAAWIKGAPASELKHPEVTEGQFFTSVIKEPRADYLTTTRLRLIITPFVLNDIDEARRYLIDGFRRQLIDSLQRFNEWSVIDGAYITQDKRTYRIDLQANQNNEHISIKIAVNSVIGKHCVWSEDFDLSLSDWYENQQFFVRCIATALNVNISKERVTASLYTPNFSLSVLDRWLYGESIAWKTTLPENNANAEVIFQEIVNDTPDFIPAYVSLINYANSKHFILPGILRDKNREKEALALAKWVNNEVPQWSRARLCLAWSYAMNGFFDKAEQAFDLAYALNPNDPQTLASSASGLALCGHHHRAYERSNEALKIGLGSNLIDWGYLIMPRFWSGDYLGCAEVAARSENILICFAAWKAAALGLAEEYSRAADVWQEFIDLARGRWVGQANPNNGMIVDWLLQSFPIRNTKDKQHLCEGLTRIGVCF